jgi:ribonucleoside-triphosphate reductase (thioredoxin)
MATSPITSVDDNVFDPTTRKIKKRDGTTVQDFDTAKIERAITAAWRECFGDSDEQRATDAFALRSVVRTVVQNLPEGTIEIETVQDMVEVALMKHGYTTVAKAYILYRQKRSEARILRDKHPDPKAISEYIITSKYARHRSDLQRRETFGETIDRTEGMHIGRFPELRDTISWAFDAVRRQEVLPSMRSLQFGGGSILRANNRIYNCSYTLVDRLDVFSEALYLLLCGCGIGYSVQFRHIDQLPELVFINQKKIQHHVVADTIEGWADALRALVISYRTGAYVEFSYHLIRPAGAPLKTSGGRAPGHTKLKSSLEAIRSVLDGAQGRQLKSIECHRIMCHSADAVLSGGVRRSAMLCLFSIDDSDMMDCKTGNWYAKEPWFQNANNSVALLRSEVREEQFKRIFKKSKQWGDPGFYFTPNLDWGCNPCCEISMNPLLVIDEEIKSKLAKQDIHVSVGEVRSGWSFCNLSTINAAKLKSFQGFMDAARAATIIGTLQASYTKMPYLGWVSETIAERDALLGVSMTGMLDTPEIACNAVYQRQVAEHVRNVNRDLAERIGIKPAARATCIKPEGTGSLALGGVASGHHAHHARRYIRRVVADELEVPFQVFHKSNPHMCARRPDGKYVIEFPTEAAANAIIKADLSALQFLEMVRSTQQNWVVPGTGYSKSTPGLTHNVSNTVHVKEDEWGIVADYLWQHKESFTGVSLLADTADKKFLFAPFEAVVTESDEAHYNHLVANYVQVDYTKIVEVEDGTSLTSEPACAGGVCAV